jgi:transaldolase
MGNISALDRFGCSVYHDGLSRSLMRDGLADLLGMGVTGLTTNPALFHQAISSSEDYDAQIHDALTDGRSPGDVMWAVVADDVRQAADELAPIHERTRRRDGYVSVEVDPTLADDADGTVAAARDLWTRIDRPNLMIKIPATRSGIACIEPLTMDGVNLNVTVVPTVEAFEAIFKAHARGLARRVDAGLEPDVHAVASVFIARIDSVVDEALERMGPSPSDAAREAALLKGRAGIAIGRSTYRRYVDLCAGVESRQLANRGAVLCRPLMASMAPKDPQRPILTYVDGLVGPDVIMTLPPVVIEALERDGRVRGATVTDDADQATVTRSQLAELGIGSEFISDGVQAIILPLFGDAMRQLEALIARRAAGARPRVLPGSKP